MKRSELLKAAPLGLLTACGGSSSLLGGAGTAARLLRPHQATCPGKQWDFEWSWGGKSDVHGTAIAYHKQGPSCAFTSVGGTTIDLRKDKYGIITSATCGFWSGDDSITFDIFTLGNTFHKGAIIKLFKKWYYQLGNGTDMTAALYDENNTMLASVWTDRAFQNTSITFYTDAIQGKKNPSSGPQTWYYNWGDTWKGSDLVVTEACYWAIAGEFGADIAWVVATLGTISGPLEWLAYAGITAEVFKAAHDALEQCR